jgi:hypothetical protein
MPRAALRPDDRSGFVTLNLPTRQYYRTLCPGSVLILQGCIGPICRTTLFTRV